MTRKTAVLAALVAAIGLSGMSGLAHAQHPTDNLGHTSKASHRKTARISAKRAAAIVPPGTTVAAPSKSIWTRMTVAYTMT